MERSCAAGGSSNGQPREESGDGSVQIQAFGKLIRSPGTCHPELGRSCAGKCHLRPTSAQSYHLPSALTLRSSPKAATCPEQPRGPGASGLLRPLPLSLPLTRLLGCGDGTGPAQPAAGSEGERLRGRGEDGPQLSGSAGTGAATSGRLASPVPALNPPASAVRGAVRAGRGRPRWQIAAAWPVPWLEGSQLFASCPWALAKRSG